MKLKLLPFGNGKSTEDEASPKEKSNIWSRPARLAGSLSRSGSSLINNFPKPKSYIGDDHPYLLGGGLSVSEVVTS
ncbi:MAG: hypothetical protein H6581_14250 [Bacteroidia bacterium]|nr:hypothetical protein [Bacteroidia bacterium]